MVGVAGRGGAGRGGGGGGVRGGPGGFERHGRRGGGGARAAGGRHGHGVIAGGGGNVQLIRGAADGVAVEVPLIAGGAARAEGHAVAVAERRRPAGGDGRCGG